MRESWKARGWGDAPDSQSWDFLEPFQGPIVGRITCANEDIVENVMIPILRRLIPVEYLACKDCDKGNPRHRHVGNWDAAWSTKSKRIKFSDVLMNRILEFKTYKQYANDPLSHDSAIIHLFHWDEEPQQKCYVINKARLSTTNGPTIGSLTPYRASEWVVSDLIEKEPERDDLKIFHMEIHDNPYISKEAVKRFLDSIDDPTERLSREKGIPGYLHGRVFKEYSEQHYIEVPHDFHEKSKDWPRTICIDPADSKPNAITWTAWDCGVDEPIPYVYRELKVRGDVQTVCSAIRAANSGDRIDLVLIDRSSMRPSQLVNQDPDIDLIFEMFKKFFPDIQPVGGAGTYDARIEKTHQLFKVNPETGMPNAYILHSCPLLDWELRHYSYKPNLASGEERKYQTIIKKNDDLVDCFCYTVATGPLKAAPLSRKPFFAGEPIYTGERVM